MAFYYTYVLRSRKTYKLYVGYTGDLQSRIRAHALGTVRSTASGCPWDLIYYEACIDRQKAIQREKYFKTGFGRRFLKGRV